MTVNTPAPRPAPRSAAAAVAADILCVLAFVAVGRRNHAEAVTAAGIAETAWPFLAGTLAGWLACRAWRAPTAVVPTGLVVWLGTVAVGIGLRAALGTGVAWSFVLVATAVTAALLLGWRALAGMLSRRPQVRAG